MDPWSCSIWPVGGLAAFRRLRLAALTAIALAGLIHSERCGAAKAEEWQAEREELQAAAEILLEQRVEALVTERLVAEELGLKWPVEKPSKSREDIIATVSEGIAKRVDETYPQSLTASFGGEAEKRYRLYKVGDRVQFVIRGGRGMHTRVRGRLRHVTKRRVHVDERWIVRSDMDEEDLARFDPELSAIMKEKYVRVQTLRWLFKREDLKLEFEQQLIPKALREAGYVLSAAPSAQDADLAETGGKEDAEAREEGTERAESIDPEDWVSAEEVFGKQFQAALEKKRRELRKEVQEEVFTEHDYVYVTAEGVWVPRAVRRSLTGKLKRLFRKQR